MSPQEIGQKTYNDMIAAGFSEEEAKTASETAYRSALAASQGGDFASSADVPNFSRGYFSGLFSDLFNTGSSAYLQGQNMDAIEDYGQNVVNMADVLTDQAISRGEFKPFTVTSKLAAPVTTAEGGFNVNLSPQQETLQNNLMTAAGSAFKEVGVDRATREQEIYNRLQTMRMPEQEREQFLLDNQLYGQGRAGLRTDAYGGTPEQLALSKAVQEQQSRDALYAMDQVGTERSNALNLGTGLLGQGYAPQQQALNMLDAGRGIAQFPNTLAQNRMTAGVNLGTKGLEGYIQSQKDLAEAAMQRNQLYAGLLTGNSGASGQGPSIQDYITGKLFDSAGNLIDDGIDDILDRIGF
jgi:hypothetical protein